MYLLNNLLVIKNWHQWIEISLVLVQLAVPNKTRYNSRVTYVTQANFFYNIMEITTWVCSSLTCLIHVCFSMWLPASRTDAKSSPFQLLRFVGWIPTHKIQNVVSLVFRCVGFSHGLWVISPQTTNAGAANRRHLVTVVSSLFHLFVSIWIWK
jgi:hypothetical protein